MKASSVLSLLVAFASSALAQDVIEASDFNVTEALIANGVDVSALSSAVPELANLTTKRSLFSPCSVAVRRFDHLYLKHAKSTYSVTRSSSFLETRSCRADRRPMMPSQAHTGRLKQRRLTLTVCSSQRRPLKSLRLSCCLA